MKDTFDDTSFICSSDKEKKTLYITTGISKFILSISLERQYIMCKIDIFRNIPRKRVISLNNTILSNFNDNERFTFSSFHQLHTMSSKKS